MQVVRASELPMVERAVTQREGRFIEKTLLQGKPGFVDNFKFYLVEQFGDFYSPRHKHNFEQIRVQLRGTTSYDKDGLMKTGTVGYFPEGTPYGPITITSKESLVVTVQFGGPSMSGYASAGERETAIKELKKSGEFRNGAYLPNKDTGRKNQDAYEACWEHINQRKLKYPKQRFQRPVLMHMESFDWIPVDDAPGVQERQLGNFQRGFGMRSLRIDPGASFSGPGRVIWYVLSGHGRAGNQDVTEGDVIYADHSDQATVAASAMLDILAISMPLLVPEQTVEKKSAAA